MTNPFQVLGVPETAGDGEIKKAYLSKVREFPPDRAPQRFQAVRHAFEAIGTHRDRLRYRLFHAEPPELSELLDTPSQKEARRPSLEQLQRALAATLTGKVD